MPVTDDSGGFRDSWKHGEVLSKNRESVLEALAPKCGLNSCAEPPANQSAEYRLLSNQ
jgi:hypothetical protein